MVRKIFFALLVFSSTTSLAQTDSMLVASFDRFFAERNDRIKDSIANSLETDFSAFLATQTPETFDFSQIKHLGVLQSPDKNFNLYLYNTVSRDGKYHFWGYLQKILPDKLEVIKLKDARDSIKEPNFVSLSPEQWYGALYYQIVPIVVDKKKYYTLLGESFNDLFTSRKVIDVLDLNSEQPVFGAPLFFDGRRKASRVIFEYSARVSMTLRYIPEQKSIVFDHLTSSMPGNRDFQFFGPDGSIDGFTFNKGTWTFKQDFDMRLPKQKKAKTFEISNY